MIDALLKFIFGYFFLGTYSFTPAHWEGQQWIDSQYEIKTTVCRELLLHYLESINLYNHNIKDHYRAVFTLPDKTTEKYYSGQIYWNSVDSNYNELLQFIDRNNRYPTASDIRLLPSLDLTNWLYSYYSNWQTDLSKIQQLFDNNGFISEKCHNQMSANSRMLQILELIKNVYWVDKMYRREQLNNLRNEVGLEVYYSSGFLSQLP